MLDKNNKQYVDGQQVWYICYKNDRKMYEILSNEVREVLYNEDGEIVGYRICCDYPPSTHYTTSNNLFPSFQAAIEVVCSLLEGKANEI